MSGAFLLAVALGAGLLPADACEPVTWLLEHDELPPEGTEIADQIVKLCSHTEKHVQALAIREIGWRRLRDRAAPSPFWGNLHVLVGSQADSGVRVAAQGFADAAELRAQVFVDRLTSDDPVAQASALGALLRLPKDDVLAVSQWPARFEGLLDGEQNGEVRWRILALLERLGPALKLAREPRIERRVVRALASPNFLEAASSAWLVTSWSRTEPQLLDPGSHTRTALEILSRSDQFWVARRAGESALRGGEPPTGREVVWLPGAFARASSGDAREALRLLELPRRPRLSLEFSDGARARIDLDPWSAPRSVARLVASVEAAGVEGRCKVSLVEAGRAPIEHERSLVPLHRGRLCALEADGGPLSLVVLRVPAPDLEGRAALLGVVIEGMETLDRAEGLSVAAAQIEWPLGERRAEE